MQQLKAWTGRSAAVVLVWFTVASAMPACAQQAPLPETPESTIGYETVASALDDIRSKPSVELSNANGWLVAVDAATRTIWSFAPADYPAYPAVVKRQVVESEGNVEIVMQVLCEASKTKCDDLVRTFAEMNGFELP